MNPYIKPRAMLAMAVAILLSTSAFSKDKPKDNVINVRGAIMDSQCAYNVHSDARSHDWMTKRNVQGASDDESCTHHCVKDMGGSYVLLSKKDVYKLDDQVKAEQFAGKKVKVSGSLDESNHTIHIFDMEEDKDK
jgi:type 1 fimbria pilin